MSEPRQCFWYDRQTGCECHAIVEAGRAVQDDGPRTEAGRSFRGACGYDHTERILAIEEQARAEGRQQADEAIGLLQEVRNSDVIFPRSDWPLSQAIAAFLDNLDEAWVAGLNASESPSLDPNRPTEPDELDDLSDFGDASESGQPPEGES